MAQYIRVPETVRLISIGTKKINYALIGDLLEVIGEHMSYKLNKSLLIVKLPQDSEKYLFIYKHFVPFVDNKKVAYYMLMDKIVQQQSTYMRTKLLSNIKK